MGNEIQDLNVQSLLAELEELNLPLHLRSPIVENLQIVLEINGTADPIQRMFKRILFTQAHATIMHYRYVKDLQKMHTDGCPVNKLVKFDEEGHIVMPWQNAIDEVDAKIISMRNERIDTTKTTTDVTKTVTTEESSMSVTLPIIGKFLSLKGKVAMIFMGWGLSVVTIVGIMYVMVVGGNTKLREEIRTERIIELQAVFSNLVSQGAITLPVEEE